MTVKRDSIVDSIKTTAGKQGFGPRFGGGAGRQRWDGAQGRAPWRESWDLYRWCRARDLPLGRRVPGNRAGGAAAFERHRTPGAHRPLRGQICERTNRRDNPGGRKRGAVFGAADGLARQAAVSRGGQAGDIAACGRCRREYHCYERNSGEHRPAGDGHGKGLMCFVLGAGQPDGLWTAVLGAG